MSTIKNIFKLVPCVIIVNLFAAPVETQTETDARSRAIGNANTAVHLGGTSVMGNPSQMAIADSKSVTVTVFPRGLGISELNILNGGLSFLLPVRQIGGTIGIGAIGSLISSDGTAIYKDAQLALGIGKSLGAPFQIGAVGLFQVRSVGDDTTSVESDAGSIGGNLNVGASYKINHDLSVGLVGMNLIRSDYFPEGAVSESAPMALKAGVGFVKPQILVALDGEYLWDSRTINVKMGSELYLMMRKLRIGIGLELHGLSQGLKPSLGFGYRVGPLIIDYAFSYSFNLGGVGEHIASISFMF